MKCSKSFVYGYILRNASPKFQWNFMGPSWSYRLPLRSWECRAIGSIGMILSQHFLRMVSATSSWIGGLRLESSKWLETPKSEMKDGSSSSSTWWSNASSVAACIVCMAKRAFIPCPLTQFVGGQPHSFCLHERTLNCFQHFLALLPFAADDVEYCSVRSHTVAPQPLSLLGVSTAYSCSVQHLTNAWSGEQPWNFPIDPFYGMCVAVR